MNSIILFVGGILLGVLISVSLVEHISNLSLTWLSFTSSSISPSTTPVATTAVTLDSLSNTIGKQITTGSGSSSGSSGSGSSSSKQPLPMLIIPAKSPTTPASVLLDKIRQSHGFPASSAGTDSQSGTAHIHQSTTAAGAVPAVTLPITTHSTTSQTASAQSVNVNTQSSSAQAQSSFRWAPGKELNMDKFKKEAELAQSHILGDSTPSRASSPIGTTTTTTATTVGSSSSSSTAGTGMLSATDLILKDYPHLQNPEHSRLVTKLRKREAQLLQKTSSTSNSQPDIMTIKQKLIELLEKKQDKEKEKEREREHQVASPASPIPVTGIVAATNTGSTTSNAPNSAAASAVATASVPPASYGSSPAASTTVGITFADSFNTHSPPKGDVSSLQTIKGSSTQYSADSRSTRPGLPPLPYHDQALRNYSAFRPYIPTYEDAKREGKPLPDMSKQKTEYEKDNLKLHLCNGVFEAYSASYLTTKQHLLSVQSESFNLSWVNCEMASFIHMRESNRFYKNPNVEGLIMQSIDVLDFSVIHLSAFERSSKKHKDVIWSSLQDRKTKWTNIDPVIEAGKILASLNDPSKRDPMKRAIQYSEEAKRTVVIMPFLGGAMGAGHSELGNRFEYLKTCFWSLYEFFPYITASVTREEDVEWALKYSGLPFYDILLIKNLPKSAGLPVGTTQHTKARLLSGAWDFDYVFFTESDQILISRELQVMYDHLKKYPGHMLLPHRLMPYSYDAITKAHKRNVQHITPTDWMTQSCCLERQNCVERKTWKPLREPDVPIINYYGLYVPLGNVNFLAESYRYCKLTPYVGDYCP